MDYREFLQHEPAEHRLPYFRGRTVTDGKRPYRLKTPPPRPGWYLLRASGRHLTVVEPCPSELEAYELRSFRGYLAAGLFFTDWYAQPLYGLDPQEEPERFAPLLAREWYDGHLLFAGQEFESEAEEQARTAYENDDPILFAAIKGVTPALSRAFFQEQYARNLERARREAAERERQTAEERARRAEEQERLARERQRHMVSFEGRLEYALSMSGAELLDHRRLDRGRSRVRYRFGGQRMQCVVDEETLQIVDAGFCLDGFDGELNLASLPSAAREALDSGQLHVW